MYMYDAIQIVDAYRHFYKDHSPTMRIDPDGEAQSLSMLIRPLGRNVRKIAIVAMEDHKRLLAYQQAGYEIQPMNGDRPMELRRFIRRMIAEIKQSPPKHMVLVSDDPEFVHLCDEAADVTDLSVWASEDNVPCELTHPNYGYHPLEEILPRQYNDTLSTARVVERNSSVPVFSRPLHVFLCHSSDDKSTVRALYQRLRKDGFDPWLDEEELLPGQDWDREIRLAVRASDVVIVCLSKGSTTKSGYVHKEMRFALDVADEQPEGEIYIVPVKLEECLAPESLRRLHWIRLFENSGYERLVKALERRANNLGIIKGS